MYNIGSRRSSQRHSQFRHSMASSEHYKSHNREFFASSHRFSYSVYLYISRIIMNLKVQVKSRFTPFAIAPFNASVSLNKRRSRGIFR